MYFLISLFCKLLFSSVGDHCFCQHLHLIVFLPEGGVASEILVDTLFLHVILETVFSLFPGLTVIAHLLLPLMAGDLFSLDPV